MYEPFVAADPRPEVSELSEEQSLEFRTGAHLHMSLENIRRISKETATERETIIALQQTQNPDWVSHKTTVMSEESNSDNTVTQDLQDLDTQPSQGTTSSSIRIHHSRTTT